MQSSLVQVPCKSGSPQGVLGWVQAWAAGAFWAAGVLLAVGALLAAGAGACASTGWVPCAKSASTAASAAMDMRIECLIGLSFLLLLQISVDQLFREFDTFELVELYILFFTPVKDCADLPR